MDDLGPLSERELEVMKLVATGATNQQIARALVISPNTVKVHLRNIFEKLGVQSRTEATIEAVRRGLVAVPGSAAAPAAGAAEEAPVAPPVVADVPVAPRPPVTGWQRAYMLAVFVAILAVALWPVWRQVRSYGAAPTPFSDAGQPQAAPAVPLDVARWTAKASLPEPRSRLALVTDGQKLYAIGGETAQGVTGEVAIYDPRSNAWVSGARKPTPVSNTAAAYLKDRIYVPGGSTVTDGVTNVLEVYDPRADTWEARASLPVPRTAYGLAALAGKLYLFGGWDGAAYRSETYVYDPASDTWTTAPPMSSPRAFLAAGATGEGIYVAGGYDGRRELDTVAFYNPTAEGAEGGPWSPRAALNQPRAGLGLTTIGARVYAVGGGWESPLTFNEQYDAKVDAWSRIATPVVGQWRNLGLAALDNMLYAVGGWSGSYLATNEAYQALIRQLLPLSTTGG